jgi:hypothetical protein
MTTARAVTVLLWVALSAALFTDAEVASAEVVRWDLQNMKFDDGGTASGFFFWNADQPGGQFITDFDIKVSGGNTAIFPAFEYTPANTPITAGDARFSNMIFFGQNFMGSNKGRAFVLTVTPGLTDAGGTSVMATDQPPGSEELFPPPIYSRHIVPGGQVTAITVPEPSRAIFLALGLAALVVCVALWRESSGWKRSIDLPRSK